VVPEHQVHDRPDRRRLGRLEAVVRVLGREACGQEHRVLFAQRPVSMKLT